MKSNETNYIKRLQQGKEDALEYIIDLYLPLIKGIVQKVLRPIQKEEVIGECVNDVFLSIWQNAHKFRGDNSNAFKSWICAIAKYKSIDYYRREVKNRDKTSEYLEVYSVKSAENTINRFENKDEVMELIRRLDPLDQKIFIMRYLLDLKSEEIAVKLNMTTSAIDNRIFRGRKKLKKTISSLDRRFIYEGHI
ncbi:sigma-70 family RNA polymerase sigma factor [Bacillus sp. PS06]|uniref:sigma-70 family RNA polymerase sigma factor n=1 Tax=Bacillus sp. PS06 TaxID=2764176 RepID=UPI0017833CDA|nr:sigma-70 family RNA polymerase sigma factor [Bacillus sp. PS06]MBD8070915.1 sigma-70 family RNA polymerase sigma factor [Bacillus sp. PS06]